MKDLPEELPTSGLRGAKLNYPKTLKTIDMKPFPASEAYDVLRIILLIKVSYWSIKDCGVVISEWTFVTAATCLSSLLVISMYLPNINTPRRRRGGQGTYYLRPSL